MSQKRLLNKWALVTGSSRGIGQQIAMALAQEGCNVIIHGRKKENNAKTLELLKPYKIRTLSVEGELSSVEAIQKLIRTVKDEVGGIDILYNNAAIQNAWKPIWDITLEEWQESFMINFYSVILLCNAFAPDMKEKGYGRIINLTSGIEDVPSLAPYSTSKAAIDKYTLDLTAELKNTNVLVNTLDPGWLKTDLGGENAMFSVETVLPGALIPALIEDNEPSGQMYSAQDFKYLK